MNRKSFILIVFTVIAFSMYSQNIKGFYVNGFNTILGNTAKEDSVLLFAQNNGFNYLTLYNVHQVNAATPLTNTTTAQSFSNFISKAKTQYSIVEVGVAAENYTFFRNVIHVYNQQHAPSNQKIDVYNLEFEFWIASSVTSGSYYCSTYLQPNGFPCDTAGAFVFYKNTLTRIDSLANATGQKSEAYFGFFNTGQAKQIVQTGVDRVLVSAYIPSANYSPSYQYNYLKPRLQFLAGANTSIKVMGLYSSEPAFMQTWVNANPFFLPYNDLTNSLTAETGMWKTYIQPEGIQWFAYSFLPKNNLTTDVPEAVEASVTLSLYPNPGKGLIRLQTNLQVNSKVLIKNILGEEVFSDDLENPSIDIDVSRFADGIYFVSLYVKDKIFNRKLVLQN
jgi:hypothetical protein